MPQIKQTGKIIIKILQNLFTSIGILITLIYAIEPYYFKEILLNTQVRLLRTKEEENYFEKSETLSGEINTQTTIPMKKNIAKTFFIEKKMFDNPIYLNTTNGEATILFYHHFPKFNTLFSPQKYMRLDSYSLAEKNCIKLQNKRENKPTNCHTITIDQGLITEQSSGIIMLYQSNQDGDLIISKSL